MLQSISMNSNKALTACFIVFIPSLHILVVQSVPIA